MSDDWGNTAPNEDDFEMSGEGVSTEDLNKFGERVDKPGWYHWEVADVKKDLRYVNDKGNKQAPYVRFDLVVLCADKPGQSPVGARHSHKIYLGGSGGGPPADGSRDSAIRFGIGLGLLKEVDGSIVDVATGLPTWKPSLWDKAKEMQIVSNLVKKAGDERFGDSFEIPFGRVYQVDDPHVADIKKDVNAMKLIGKASAASTTKAAPAKSAGKAAASKPAAAPTGAASGGGIDLSDL